MAYKMLKIGDLRKMNANDLEKEVTQATAELANRRIHVRIGEDKQSHMIGGLQKYIARINTLKLEKPQDEK